MFASRCSECGALSASPWTDAFAAVAPGTRHQTLLNNNEPPDDFEKTYIQSVISETDARLACLDEEMAKLQNTLKQLEEARASLLSCRTRNSAILSPLRRMPPEVLGEIFSWTPASLRAELARGRFDMAHSPWVLTRISSRWRAVSLSTPSLWSRVAIDYPASRDPLAEYPLSLVETFIQRSQKLKIHFYACPDKDSRHQIRMFELLSQHAPRWEELSLGLTPAIVPLLPTLRDRLLSLKRLWIQWNTNPEGLSIESIEGFDTIPSLIDVGVFNEFAIVPITFLSLNQLTRYECDAPWKMHKGILRLAPNLVEVRIVVKFDDDEESWLDSSITDLMHLQRLFMSKPELLGHLRAPALEELALPIRTHNNPDIPQLLEAFLDRSACPLRRLGIQRHPNTHTITTILQKLPCITELFIMIHDFDASSELNSLMSTLIVSKFAGSTVVAPQLRSLDIGSEDTNCVDFKVYLEMLKSRWEDAGCALKKTALLTERSGPDHATLCGLQALRGEGLDLLLVEGEEAIDKMDLWVYGTSWN